MKTAFPEHQGTTKIRLYSNIPFDNSYSNHSLLSTLFKYNNTDIGLDDAHLGQPLKEMFINRKDYSKTGNPYYYPRYDLSGEYNFDYVNGLVSSVVLELTPEQTNANYMRVESWNNLGSDYYYYFITGITQINADTYRLNLELDVLMTYQNEFLAGMKGVPVFTDRKHCHRYDDTGIVPFSADFKTGDDVFAGIKPSIISSLETLQYDNAGVKKLKDVVWLYICSDGEVGSSGNPAFLSSFDGIQYPFTMMALPVNVSSLVFKAPDDTVLATFSQTDIKTCIVKYLIGSGAMHGAKLSYFPPFASETASNITFSAGVLTIKATAVTTSWGTGNFDLLTIGGNNFVVCVNAGGLHGDFFLATSLGCMVINSFSTKFYEHSAPTILNTAFDNTNAPTPYSNRYDDPKLLFAPFKKYALGSPYNSDTWEFFPELLFSEYPLTSSSNYFKFSTLFTPYIEDNNFYTILKPINVVSSEYAFDNYQYAKVGAISNVNYRMPVGTNALDVFNASQSQSFYTSKVASGITSGLTMAGGIAQLGMGIAGFAGGIFTGGLSAIKGGALVASGATTLASGVAGISTTLKSSVAKIEDLKNTPDNVNLGGSNFITDNAIMGNKDKMPFVMISECTSVVKEKANDFLYNYGYQVARECYFNTELLYNATKHKTDNELFGRAVFNYIKLQEDITNKINYNIPLIIKQKISQIFNNGITLWSFFGNTELWYGQTPASALDYLDRWFLKCDLDNTECNLVLHS